jgi:hypothetical protein
MGTWQSLPDHPLPDVMLLLTDGSVLCRSVVTQNWSRFRPDSFGRYDRGTWVTLTSRPRVDALAAATILKSGRVLILSPTGADIYDPERNVWEEIPTSALNLGYRTDQNLLYPPLCVLTDGRVLVGLEGNFSSDIRFGTALLDPDSRTGMRAADRMPTCGGIGVEDYGQWVLLPGGSVLTIACTEGAGVSAQLFQPDLNRWHYAGASGIEIARSIRTHILSRRTSGHSPLLLLPDGRVLVVGDHQMFFFDPPTEPTRVGTWQSSSQFPESDPVNFSIDYSTQSACVLPNGNVFCAAIYTAPTGPDRSLMRFFEFDPTPGRESFVLQAGRNFELGGHNFGLNVRGGARMLLLPSGQVLVSVWGFEGDGVWGIYTPESDSINEALRPRLTSWPSEMQRDRIYRLQGMQLNGLSQAVSNVSWPRDVISQNATNYPLVQLQNLNPRIRRSQLWYCPTFSYSNLGVATGDEQTRCSISIPRDVPSGAAKIRVVTNGIPSEWVDTFVAFDPGFIIDELMPELWNQLLGTPNDGPLLVIGPDGKIRPIPPWDPNAKEVLVAYEQMRRGIEVLRVVGNRLSVAEELARVEGPFRLIANDPNVKGLDPQPIIDRLNAQRRNPPR